MGRGRKVLTRRDFLRAGSSLAVGGLMGVTLLGSSPVEKRNKSRVVLIRDKDVFNFLGEPKQSVLEKMLDEALNTLLGVSDSVSAWRRLVTPSDIVGIKSNVWYHLPTPGSLEKVIVKRLVEAGVREKNIAIDDRKVLKDPVFKRATALINIRPMRTHHWSGLGTLIKNYIMFTPQPWMYHGNACERLGAVWQLPPVQGKTRLNILVMLTPLFHGIGPHHFSSRYTWPYGGLIVSTDPVAADTTGAGIIQAKRDDYFGEQRPISPPPLHIAAADTRFGLGNSRTDRIQLIRLGWEKDLLV